MHTNTIFASAVAPGGLKESLLQQLLGQEAVHITLFSGAEHIIETYPPSLQALFQNSIGKPAKDVLALMEGASFFTLLNEVYYTGETVSVKEKEYHFKNERGEWVTYFFNATYQPWKNTEGVTLGVLSIATDCTEEVLHRRQLTESESLFRQVAETMPQLVWMAKADGTVFYYNCRIAEFSGATRSADGQWRWADLLHEDDAQPTADAWSAAVASGTVYEKEHRIKMTDGSYKWHLSRAFPQRDTNGTIQSWHGTATDIDSQKKAEERLAYKKALLEAQNETIPDGLLIVDENRGQMLSFNRHFAEIWRMPADIIASRDDNAALAFAMNQVADPEGFMKRVRELYASGNAAAKEEILLKDGRILERHGKAVIGESGIRYGWAWHFRDITEARRTAVEIQLQKRRYENLLEGVSDAFMSYDHHWNIIYVNKKAEALSGLTAATMMGQNLWQTFPFLENTPIKRLYERSMSERRPAEIEYFSPTTNAWREVRLYPIEDGLAAFSTDISERKKVEDELRKSEERFRTMADVLPQILWTANPDGSVDYFNDRWYAFTGFEKGIGDDSWLLILHPENIQPCLDAWYHSVKTGEPYSIEYRFKDRSHGSYRWFLGKALPIKDADGKITKWFGTCTDIHDQKTMSEKLELLVAERTRELQRSNADLQQFAHVASHDMREPLRKIRTFGSRLAEEYGGLLPEKGQFYLERSNHAALRMDRMIEGVLEYARLDTEELDWQLVDLNKTAEGILLDLELTIQQKSAVINYQHLPSISGAPILLQQVLYNLLHNALKFARPDVPPVIIITHDFITGKQLGCPLAKQDGAYLRLQIQDNGIGFSPEQTEHIFETFTRLHSKDRYEGNGLGLALCRKIVQRHNGYIRAKSLTDGALFEVLLPA